MLTRSLVTALILSAAACTHAGAPTMTASDPSQPEIPGYTHGSPALPDAPITLEELDLIFKTALFSDEDVKYLRMSRDVLEPHVDELLGVWYGFVGANPHLLASFSHPETGEPQGEYLERVRLRFGRWVLDTAAADFDQDWLDYQFEIGRRHHRVGKNETDNANAEEHIRFRYLQPLTIPVTTTLRPFLERGGHSAEDVDKMHAAWVKIVTVQAVLWSEPYVRDGDF
ncbi:MAG: protoglobin domain-containing protein [Phycisphaerales bacterium]